MMTADQLAAVASSIVRIATLVDLHFRLQTMWVWNGAGRLTIGGTEYDGLKGFGSIDGLQQSREPVSSKVTLKLSGVSAEILAIAKRTTEDVQGRPLYVWQQLFNDRWRPVGPRIPIFWGTMQRINVVRGDTDVVSGGSRVCELEVENPFAGRSRPAAGRWTDADQQARHPGDRFCRFVPRQRTQTITWPDY